MRPASPATVFVLVAVVACGPTLGRSQPLDLQEKCASQARKAFQELENEAKTWGTSYKGDRGLDKYDRGLFGEEQLSSTYQSHYNTKLNRCLMLMTVFYQGGYGRPYYTKEEVTLVDANEGRVFASYQEEKLNKVVAEEERTGQKTSGKVLECILMPSIRHKMTCNNPEEFEAFAPKYMEE